MIILKLLCCIVLWFIFVSSIALGVEIGLKQYFEKGRKNEIKK